MKKLIFLLLISSQVFAQDAKTIVVHGDTLWLKNFTTDDSMQLNKLPFKTVNGDSLRGIGNLVISGSGASWGSVTGTLSSQTDLQSALDLKQNISSSLGYSINVQALTNSPADGATVYFGMMPKAPITTANVSKIYIRKTGTLKIAEIYCYSGTAGTAESWSLYVRKNNTTDYLIATLTAATSERVFSNTGLSVAVTAGDYLEIKSIQPTWATNPLTTIYGGYLYFE